MEMHWRWNILFIFLNQSTTNFYQKIVLDEFVQIFK